MAGKNVVYLDGRLRKVLHSGSDRGKYERENFRSFMREVQEQMRVNSGFSTPADHEGILDIYSFNNGDMDVRHYSLSNRRALVLITADKAKTSVHQRKELAGYLSGALVR